MFLKLIKKFSTQTTNQFNARTTVHFKCFFYLPFLAPSSSVNSTSPLSTHLWPFRPRRNRWTPLKTCSEPHNRSPNTASTCRPAPTYCNSSRELHPRTVRCTTQSDRSSTPPWTPASPTRKTWLDCWTTASTMSSSRTASARRPSAWPTWGRPFTLERRTLTTPRWALPPARALSWWNPLMSCKKIFCCSKHCLFTTFVYRIRHLREAGIIDWMIRQVISGSRRRQKFNLKSEDLKRIAKRVKEKKETEDVRVFSLSDLKSVFIISAAGELLSFVTFIFEYFLLAQLKSRFCF